MNTQKVAITVPKDLIVIVDEISRLKGISRSKLISRLLSEKVQDEKDQQLREAYNRVFSDDAIRKEQLETAEWFEGSGNKEGQGW
jgi:metal-responsive CopG/Arc/MetJ family transcriptional regulator